MIVPQTFTEVPAETARVAQAAFPKGHIYLTVRDALGEVFADGSFSDLFSTDTGRPAVAPGRLALITALQFAEDLSDRQTSDAVRGRLEWKYLLGLELTDPGFDHAVLCGFRERLLVETRLQQVLETFLDTLRAHGWLKQRSVQRSDSTYVLAAVREVNRLENMGETVRYALNALATVLPEWVRTHIPKEWIERYGQRFEQFRLPTTRAARTALATDIGQDGYALLQQLYDVTLTPKWVRQVPAVETLRQVWVQQYVFEDAQLRWRTARELPPSHLLIVSPYDPEARNSVKRQTQWSGYKVHFTENCTPDAPPLITNVETTASTTPDVVITPQIHQHLADHDVVPETHLVDAGYVDTAILTASATGQAPQVMGPAPTDKSWQARTHGLDVTCFNVDWEQQRLICPQGHTSRTWSPSHDKGGHAVIHISFARADCLVCPQRTQCTRSKRGNRTLKLRPQEQQEALWAARQRQTTPTFQAQYQARAGVEGSLSQAIRRCGLRRSRYRGLAKTRLQHLFTAIGLNLVRLAEWLRETPRSATRVSRFVTVLAT